MDPKIGKEPNTGASKDIISKLPDCILNSILSLLPTKDAIRTSLLSTRWQHLWTSLSHIDLDEGFESNASLFNFVERFLLRHDASDIKSFRLCFSCPVNPSRVHSWVSAVVKHKVEEIALKLPLVISLPCCLFTCESLAVLKISMPGVLKVPTVVRLPHLKILELSRVILSNEDPIERFLSNCPVLQDLSIDVECRWEDIERVTISIPSLKRLSFSSYSMLDDMYDCTIEIYASNLVFLEYESDFQVDCILYDLPSSVNASIAFMCLQEGFFYRALHLLNCVQNVKSLSVNGEDFLEAGNLAELVSTLYKLTTLSLEFGITRLATELLMDFLQKAPTLECLEIRVMDVPGEVFNEDWALDEDVVPCCFESHLKTIDITFCRGYKKELHLVKLLLKNTTVLERMMIRVWYELWGDSELLEQVRNQVQMFPRGSESCVIEFLEGQPPWRIDMYHVHRRGKKSE